MVDFDAASASAMHQLSPKSYMTYNTLQHSKRKGQGYKMPRRRNYWSYSAASGIAWAVALLLIRIIRGSRAAQSGLLVFFGWCICWVSATIARYIYPPPKRWELNRRHE